MTRKPEAAAYAQQHDIIKASDELRVVWGWASVATEGGRQVLDQHNDTITEAEIQKAAHAFVSDHRVGKVLHNGVQVAEVVESVVFTEALQKALGVDTGRTGWFIAMKILDDAVWQDVKDGKFPMFSIGGRGVRVEAA